MTSKPKIHPVDADTEKHRAQNPYWQQRQHLGSALRDLGNMLCSREISEQDAQELTHIIQSYNQKLQKLPEIKGRKGWLDHGLAGSNDKVAHELSPLIGKSSVIGPELKVKIEGDTGIAEVNCDWRFEGPPMCLHGGFVAALFDEFLGWVQMLSGGSGATKNLSVTYHKPTPLNTPLTLKAKLHSVEGRKIKVHGELYANDLMTATAEGLFISFGELGTRELYKNL